MAKELNREIGARVRAAREAADMGQADLGRELGFTATNQMWRLEAGKSGFTLDALIKISKALRQSLDLLVFGVPAEGLEPALSPAQRRALLLELGASEEQVDALEQHLVAYPHHRATDGFVRGYAYGWRAARVT